MKKCPFCAEEIQDEAIKCRYCNSWLAESERGRARAHQSRSTAGVLGQSSSDKLEKSIEVGGKKTLIFEGKPSWRAYLRSYSVATVAGIVFAAIAYSITGSFDLATPSRAVLVGCPLLVAALALGIVEVIRRSQCYRISSHHIETEYGVLRKRIDSVELWRGRDIRYKQSFPDRVLRISHISIYTTDKTTPEIVLRGMPASRKLFEHIRDAIDIQRQARNVIGMVE